MDAQHHVMLFGHGHYLSQEILQVLPKHLLVCARVLLQLFPEFRYRIALPAGHAPVDKALCFDDDRIDQGFLFCCSHLLVQLIHLLDLFCGIILLRTGSVQNLTVEAAKRILSK